MSASTTTAPTAPPSEASAPSGTQPTSRGGRGSRNTRPDNQHRGRGQDGQRQRRGGRGGGAKHPRAERASQADGPIAHETTRTEVKPAAVKVLQQNADSESTTKAPNGIGTDDAVDEAEAEVCFICASPVAHQAVAPCNHRTCHICALRLRALYKTRACAHCRSESGFVIFTDDPSKRYEEFRESEFERTDEGLGIKYEKQEIYDDTILLLRYNCPDQDCDIACYGWPDLHRHVRTIHHKVMCDLCTRNKKVFTHEHDLYSQADLRKHERFGDDDPGAVDQTGFKGHPECGFCRQRFYGDDELYVHCREKHERCHLCDRRNHSRAQQYFVNYDALEVHFRKDHFLCIDQECLDKKFVVFDSEMDLKAHQLESHPNGMSKDVRREARIVDMSTFDFRTPHQDDRRGGRGGRGRGRDPNAEPLPASSAQPLRRDELAYQRALAIHSAQSTTSRTFGGQLTSSSTNRPQPPQPQAATAPRRPANDLAPVAPNSTLESVPSAVSAAPDSSDPRAEARRLQHQAVMDRAGVLLLDDASKLETFRSRVSAYQRSAIGATELVETFFSLMDAPTAEVGTLIKELAEIYENDSKRAGLLNAWQDWRAINEDYPTLPGPSGGGSAAAPATGAGGRRVLKLKSASAQSGRAAVSRQATGWGNMPALAAASRGAPQPARVAFPTLPAASAGAGSARKAGPTPTPWAGAAGGSTSNAGSARQSPAPSRAAVAAPPPAARDAFPELPRAARPNTHMMGLHRGNVQWGSAAGAPKAGAWGGGGAATGAAAAAAAAENGLADGGGGSDLAAAQAGGKKKGNRKGKEVLYKFG